MIPTSARNDRCVHTCRLTVGPAAPIHKLAFSVEEALRLCSLPGEDEGRVYYFRRVHISGLPENGDRNTWIAAFQTALLAQARNAVDGRCTGSKGADAVYFQNQQEACELLLDRIVRRQPADAWFWQGVSDSASGASAATHVGGIIAKLSRSDASWFSVAAAAFASSNPVVLLSLISESTARAWLRDLHREGGSPGRVAIGNEALRIIARGVQTFGAEDPRVIWLAALAVILASPSEIESGTSVTHARAILGTFLESATQTHTGDRAKLQTFPEPGGVRAPALPPGFLPANSIEGEGRLRAVNSPSSGGGVPLRNTLADEPPELQPQLPQSTRHKGHSAVIGSGFGERTEAAGLFFLLNALKHLRFPECQLSPRFLAHLIQRIAIYAGVKPEDPILLWATITLGPNESEPIDERLARTWLRKVRRWCWRKGTIGLRAIVRRPGLVTLTRTDLDILLSIDAADIRIRRIGLDLDPGWLPWFGRVVRFHYLYRGDIHG